MKKCKRCGEMNSDDDLVCFKCSSILEESILNDAEKFLGNDDFTAKLKERVDSGLLDRFSSMRKADIMFVFDCTGSMMGEIRAMQDAIIDFADAVKAEGLDIRLGLIEFRDRFEGEEPVIHKFHSSVFTTNMAKFKRVVDTLRATGGGPAPESSPDAIMLALKQKFRDIPNKTIVLITDAPPHLPDKSTKSYKQVIMELEKKDINQFYVVTMLKNKACQVHLQLLEGVHNYGGDGLAFELSKKDDDRKNHFKKVLMGLAKSITSKSV